MAVTQAQVRVVKRTYTLYPADLRRLRDLQRYFAGDKRGRDSKIIRRAIANLHEQLVPASVDQPN